MFNFNEWLVELHNKHRERNRKFHVKSRRNADNWDYVSRITGITRYDELDEIIEKISITLKRLRGESDDTNN